MGLWTYDDTTRRESLLSIMKDVSPAASTYLFENLGKSEASNTLHEWPVRAIGVSTSAGNVAEGSDSTDGAGDPPTRSNNICAIFKRIVKVTGTQDAVKRALPGSAMADEKKVKLMRLKSDIEYGLINGTKASGASGTARQQAGLTGVISTNLTAKASGATFNLVAFEAMHQMSWDAVGTEGFVASTLLCPIGVKRTIAGYTTRITNYKEDTKRAYNNVEVFESAAGEIKIVPHKQVNAGAASEQLLAINENMYRMAFLTGREPKFENLAKGGDYELGHYITELTLESLAERASVNMVLANRAA